MALDPAAGKLLELMGAAGLGFSPDVTPESMRAAMEAATSPALRAPHEVAGVEDRTIAGPAGPLSVRVYRPSDAPALPVVLWLHGGGWVTGSLSTHDSLCRLLCDDAQAIVVAVGYRLAPETRFPGAFDDCVATWRWLAGAAAEVGGDPQRLALAGDSAGGNLAAAVAIATRDVLPAPRLQLLVYPVTDHEFERPSMRDNATGYFLETEQMRWFFDHYARTPADFDDWRMSPLRAPDLAGLPPAFVVTAEYDPLRDQGEAYGERLRAAGVPVRIVRGEGLFHGFFGMHALVPAARGPWDAAVDALRHAFGGSG